jgi:hypothetical protein
MKPTTGTFEWMPNSENCIEGCDRDCRYCYGKKNAIRFNRRTAENWHEMKPNARFYRPVRLHPGGVMFPTTHDLPPSMHDVWSAFLTDLLRAGNQVLIVSKPSFWSIKFICDNFQAAKGQIEFRFTIGTDNEFARAYWEPGAPQISERIRSLRYAYEMGYETSVSMEPLLMKDPSSLIWQVSPWVTRTIWIGTMNHMLASDFPDFCDETWHNEMLIINSKENMTEVYEQNKNNPLIRWKDSVQRLLNITQTGERLP